MKRFFAIVLLSVHVFYLGGYALVFQYFIRRADEQMVKQVFDNKIDATKLVLLKIPVNMPTVTDWSDYEVITGQIQLKNAYYTYVRMKLTRDTMYFICLANKTKTRLVNANIITERQITDVPLSKKGDPGAKKVNSLSEYNIQIFKYHFSDRSWLLKNQFSAVKFSLNSPYIESPGKPPNYLS